MVEIAYPCPHTGTPYYISIIYIYKVVISVSLFVCPIITREPLDRFALNFDLETR